GDQPQRLVLTTAANQDRRVRLLDRRRVAHGMGELVMLASVGARVAGPHAVGDLEELLQALEALLDRGKPHAQADVLLLEPGSADAKEGPTARQNVERRRLLHQ